MWYDAKGYENRLQVTKCGRVRSIDRYVDNWPRGKRLIKGRELKCSVSKAGYKMVDLRSKSKCEKSGCVVYLHRIIAATFLDNSDGFDVVNHKDGDKKNNSVGNLEWCTAEYNSSHAWHSGLNDHNKKPVIASDGKSEREFESLQSTRHFGFNPSLVHAALNGKQKTHKGLTWSYK